MQASIITSTDPDFPDILRHIARPIKNINILGILPNATRTMVAVVGSAACTGYGAKVAYTIAWKLSEANVTVKVLSLGAGLSAGR
jgi:predicted Rossmann fold nucleotide-binding protein DprA/Smf involved in DNA uptake